MIINNPSTAQVKLAHYARQKRLALNLTQSGLANRAGVSLSSLRKFEQKGLISLQSYLKILMVLNDLEKLLNAMKLENKQFLSIDDVLQDKTAKLPQRGKRS